MIVDFMNANCIIISDSPIVAFQVLMADVLDGSSIADDKGVDKCPSGRSSFGDC